MLTKELLGKAIGEAIRLKGVTQAQLAHDFGVRPPSVTDWIKRGTIDKGKLPKLWQYFSDVVGPEHWGLSRFPWATEYQVREPGIIPYHAKAEDKPFEEMKILWGKISDAGRHELIGMARLISHQSPRNAQRTKRL